MIYDVIVIGSGPAGMTAGIYAKRAGMEALILEGSFVKGGQIVDTQEIDNYPGLPGISGAELAEKIKEHLARQGVEIKRGKVTNISLQDDVKVIHTKKADYYAKTVVLASGAVHRKLEVPGEEEFSGSGVSYCATCDGAFFEGKTVAVVGGGDVAVEDALLLSGICEKVYVIQRRDELRAAKVLQDALKKAPNVEFCWNRTVTKIGGESQVQWMETQHTHTGVKENRNVDGVFVAVGTIPDTAYVKNIVNVDASGYIIAGEDGKTNIPGIYAAGDVRTKALRQIITAAADGANCINSAEAYLRSFC